MAHEINALDDDSFIVGDLDTRIAILQKIQRKFKILVNSNTIHHYVNGNKALYKLIWDREANLERADEDLHVNGHDISKYSLANHISLDSYFGKGLDASIAEFKSLYNTNSKAKDHWHFRESLNYIITNNKVMHLNDCLLDDDNIYSMYSIDCLTWLSNEENILWTLLKDIGQHALSKVTNNVYLRDILYLLHTMNCLDSKLIANLLNNTDDDYQIIFSSLVVMKENPQLCTISHVMELLAVPAYNKALVYARFMIKRNNAYPLMVNDFINSIKEKPAFSIAKFPTLFKPFWFSKSHYEKIEQKNIKDFYALLHFCKAQKINIDKDALEKAYVDLEFFIQVTELFALVNTKNILNFEDLKVVISNIFAEGNLMYYISWFSLLKEIDALEFEYIYMVCSFSLQGILDKQLARALLYIDNNILVIYMYDLMKDKLLSFEILDQIIMHLENQVDAVSIIEMLAEEGSSEETSSEENSSEETTFEKIWEEVYLLKDYAKYTVSNDGFFKTAKTINFDVEALKEDKENLLL